MNNIFLLNDSITNGFRIEFVDIIYLVSILLGILTISSRNPVVSVLFLIGLFVNVAGLLILVGYNFIGLAYILVYVGAVSILFLFILMLINIRISELQSNTRNSIPLALFIAVFFNYSLFQILPYDLAILNNSNNYLNNILYNIYLNKNTIENKILNVNNDLFFASSNS
jgi:NADH-ubiquinone oxidoreductase chain 6